MEPCENGKRTEEKHFVGNVAGNWVQGEKQFPLIVCWQEPEREKQPSRAPDKNFINQEKITSRDWIFNYSFDF
jgi:hypothetical protein